MKISMEQRIWLIKAYLDNTLNEEEQAAFQRWLEASPANRELLERIRDNRLLWEKIDFCDRHDLGKEWEQLQRKLYPKRHRVSRYTRYAAVAAVLLTIGTTFLYRLSSHVAEVPSIPIVSGNYKAYLETHTGERWVLGDTTSKLIAQVDRVTIRETEVGVVTVSEEETLLPEGEIGNQRLVVPRGGEYRLVLPDGTQVWLNSDSWVEFPSRFAGQERRIRLNGEACLEVEKDSKPFVVEVDNCEIEVLGTTFNISNHGDRFVTTLATGKVAVRLSDSRTYSLEPSMQLREEHGQVTLERVNVADYIAWKEGWFVFRKMKLKEVMDILSRWYDITIQYQDTQLQELHFTGTIKRHSDIREVVQFLERTGMVNFGIEERTLIVSK